MGELSNTTINGVSYDFKDAGAARQSHSHTKSQITDFPTSMPASDVPAWAKASTKPTYTASEVGAIATSAKGAANGVASLDSAGKVPSSQLPSYVDDVLEYDAKVSFPTTGETGKIYVDKNTNKTYRWSGSDYVEISESLALGETSSTAYRGDRGKTAYDHSQVTSGNPHNTTAAETGAVPNTSAGVSAAINLLTTGDSAPTDNDYYVSQYAGGGTSTTTYHRRPVSKLWDYIKSKLTSTTTSANLTDTEKSNARANIGAAAASDVAVSYISAGDFFTPYPGGSILSETLLFKQGKHMFGFIKVKVMSNIPLVGTVKTPYRPARYDVPGMLYLQNANDTPQPIPCTISTDGSINASKQLISGAFVYFYVDYIIA